MTSSAAVVAWSPGSPSVRLMARGTAEAAARNLPLRVFSAAPRPGQWAAWQTAASDLGVRATWQRVPGGTDGLPDALRRESSRSPVVVVDTDTVGGTWHQLVRLSDVYVTARVQPRRRTVTHEPAVVVGVSGGPESPRLQLVASHEAELRGRHLVVVHAEDDADHGGPLSDGSILETPSSGRARRYLEVPARVPTQVVFTRRPVGAALRDHVEADDVLVVGVHPDEPVGSLDEQFFRTSPCDLLLTLTVPTCRSANAAGHSTSAPTSHSTGAPTGLPTGDPTGERSNLTVVQS